jgi:hypothetical protein
MLEELDKNQSPENSPKPPTFITAQRFRAVTITVFIAIEVTHKIFVRSNERRPFQYPRFASWWRVIHVV